MATKKRTNRVKKPPAWRYGAFDPILGKRVRLRASPHLKPRRRKKERLTDEIPFTT